MFKMFKEPIENNRSGQWSSKPSNEKVAVVAMVAVVACESLSDRAEPDTPASKNAEHAHCGRVL